MALHNVTGIWDTNSDEYKESFVHVYHNNTWMRCKPWAYVNGVWQEIGGAATLMIPFVLSDNKLLITSDNKPFLVPSHD